MAQYRTLLATFLLASLAVLTLGCGGMSNPSNRVLQSMVIMPANVDAQTFSKGQVQFAATGTFSKAPSPDQVTFQAPYSGSWSLMGAGAGTIATVSPTGLAQCVPGAAGTVTVNASASSNAATGTGATSTMVSSTTTMTCP